MTIYTTYENDKYEDGMIIKYWANKEKAEAYVAENDKPWTNANGITWHTCSLGEEIITED